MVKKVELCSDLLPESPLLEAPTKILEAIEIKPRIMETEVKGRKVRAVTKPISSSVVKELKMHLKDKPVSYKINDTDLQEICGSLLDTIIGMVKEGKNVTFANRLTFKRVYRKDRECRNPQTGDKIKVAGHYSMKMSMMEKLNEEFKNIVL